MDSTGSVDSRPACYAFDDVVLALQSPAFPDAVAEAYAQRLRPRCLCQPRGVPMYIAQWGPTYLIKRMPDTGPAHAPDCGSYQPPVEWSGRGEVAPAIREDVTTGLVSLRVNFPLSQRPGRPGAPAAGEPRGSVRSPGSRLTLRGLLHYLWEQAELNRWHPGFAGRRTWGTVRRHLLRAAQRTTLGGQPLADRLYLPEVFSVAQREVLAQRRRQQWASALPRDGQPQPLLLMLAELKELVPARYGHSAVLKHLPDVTCWLDATLMRRLARHFDAELATWGAEPDLHLVLLATAVLSDVGRPTLVEVSLMLTTATWLPADGGFEAQLLQALVQAGRCFSKPLRYQLTGAALPAAVLTDTDDAPTPLFLVSDDGNETVARPAAAWCWSPRDSVMPALPARRYATFASDTTPSPPPPPDGGMQAPTGRADCAVDVPSAR